MAVTDYTSLKSAISTWLDRSDIEADADSFVAFAENIFNDGFGSVSPVRSYQMVDKVTINAASDVFALPNDYLMYRSVTSDDGHGLRYVTPQVAANQFEGDSGGASTFTLIGDNIHVYPSIPTSISLIYIKRIPALSDANPTNWLLERSPVLYLNAAIMHAALYIKDDAEFARRGQLVAGLIDGVNGSTELAEFANVNMSIEGAV